MPSVLERYPPKKAEPLARQPKQHHGDEPVSWAVMTAATFPAASGAVEIAGIGSGASASQLAPPPRRPLVLPQGPPPPSASQLSPPPLKSPPPQGPPLPPPPQEPLPPPQVVASSVVSPPLVKSPAGLRREPLAAAEVYAAGALLHLQGLPPQQQMPAPITRLPSSDGAASGASYYGSSSWEVPASNVSEAASGGSRSFHNLVQGSPDNGQDTGIVEGPYGGLCRCIRQLGFEDSLGLRLTGVAYSRCVRHNLAPQPRS